MLFSARNNWALLLMAALLAFFTGCSAHRQPEVQRYPKGWGWVVSHPQLDREVLKTLNLPEEGKKVPERKKVNLPRVTVDTQWDVSVSRLMERPELPGWVKKERFCKGKNGVIAPCILFEEDLR